jgi:hypothetical protein
MNEQTLLDLIASAAADAIDESNGTPGRRTLGTMLAQAGLRRVLALVAGFRADEERRLNSYIEEREAADLAESMPF